MNNSLWYASLSFDVHFCKSFVHLSATVNIEIIAMFLTMQNCDSTYQVHNEKKKLAFTISIVIFLHKSFAILLLRIHIFASGQRFSIIH